MKRRGLTTEPKLAVGDGALGFWKALAEVFPNTRAQAVAAARLVEIEYAEEEPVLDIDDPRAAVEDNPFGRASSRGDVPAALAGADVTVDETYTIGAEANSPMGLFTTVASWQGGRLVVHDTTQSPSFLRVALAVMFEVPGMERFMTAELVTLRMHQVSEQYRLHFLCFGTTISGSPAR